MYPRQPAASNKPRNLPFPVGGYNASAPLMGMKPLDAVLLENWFPGPTSMETRDGYVSHITATPKQVDRLHVYSSQTGAETLWGTTADGIYNFTAAGAAPAVSMALTNGKTFSTAINTGSASYMLVVNGTDTLKQYNGAAWSSVATFGATATSIYSYIETYRQRIFLIKKNSLEIEYLASNAISGAATNYPLGALFRLGGYLVALGVWTIDGGIGPEDNLVAITNKGEIAVFAGNDPATWSLKGVYFIGRPLGDIPLYKYGGDILALTETGIIPLSSVMQSVSIDRKQTVSSSIRPFVINVATSAFASQGWQIISDPLKPMLLVNIPSSPVRKQVVMNSQTGAWATFTGWNAIHFARMNGEMYFSCPGTVNTFTVKRINGPSDQGVNVTATMVQAYNSFGFGVEKKVEACKSYFQSNSDFTYNGGFINDFQQLQEASSVNNLTVINGGIWGSSLWGAAVWSGTRPVTNDWQTFPDDYSHWKALYLQVTTSDGKVSYLGSDMLFKTGGHF